MDGLKDNLVGGKNPKEVWNGTWRMLNAYAYFISNMKSHFYKTYLILINAHEDKN